MTVSNTSGVTTTAASAASSLAGGATIANNFDQFLSLLTTQLKNQSPLDPLETNQFTTQLVQFAGVEQQLRMNDTLASLLTLNQASTATDAVGFIGKTITADGATSPLKNGAAHWSVNMPEDGTAIVTIKNSAGVVVQTMSSTFKSGAQTLQWDGTTSTGIKAPDGDYTITVDAQNLAGKAVTARTEIIGVVDGVDMSGTAPVLKIGAISVPVNKVTRVVQAQTQTAAESH
jgi:flagellar basal-body rod modification protein FlgD